MLNDTSRWDRKWTSFTNIFDQTDSRVQKCLPRVTYIVNTYQASKV
jgi:hypothetical protein